MLFDPEAGELLVGERKAEPLQAVQEMGTTPLAEECGDELVDDENGDVWTSLSDEEWLR